MSQAFERRGKIGAGALGFLLITTVFPQEPVPPAAMNSSPQTAPASSDAGSLLVSLSGNRQFCVAMNELEISEAARKPREQRNAPLMTTMGYKYQISVSRRGSAGVTKLLESPTFRTIYWESAKKSQELPQPRLPTEKDLKKASRPYGTNKIPRWVPQNRCTTLQPEYQFPLPEGQYDVYLGFDLLGINGQWVPLESDFITNLVVEKGKTSRVQGKVDNTDGVRTVKLEAPGKTTSAGGRR